MRKRASWQDGKKQGGTKMLFEDDKGQLLMQDEIEELSWWELEDRGIHVFAQSDRVLL